MFKFVLTARPAIPVLGLVVPALAGLLVAGCSVGPFGNVNILSTEDEVKLGQQTAAQVDQQLHFIGGDAAAYVNDIGQLLVRHSERSDIPYTFKLVNSAEVNAFSLPGGFVYVNRAILEQASNESEVAGVIGHEIGHVVGRHAAKQFSRQYGLSVILGIALGQDPSALEQIAANVLAQGTLLRYGREAEFEADQYGIHETYDSGIDPHGMSTFLHKLLSLEQTQPSSVSAIFATHPPTSDRIDRVDATIAGLARRSLSEDSDRFHRVKSALQSMAPPPDAQAARK